MKPIIKLLLISIVSSFILASCSLSKGTISFERKADEIIATPQIKDYLKKNPNPTIVLKAPNSENKATQSDPNSYIYNAIEKELLLAGFNVKDRGLFNEVVGKSKEINYEELKKLTNTQLLLELVNVSTRVEYGTNVFITENGDEKVANQNFKLYGAVIEFKLTIIETNQFAGSYSFYITPCSASTSGCECEVAYKNYRDVRIYPHLSFCNTGEGKVKEYTYVTENAMEKFVRNGVKKMIYEIIEQ